MNALKRCKMCDEYGEKLQELRLIRRKDVGVVMYAVKRCTTCDEYNGKM